MKRENNKKFKKRKRNQNRSLTCRVLSMMFAIVLFCSTVLINTDYVSQASSFDDMVDMVEVEEDSAAADTSEDTGDDLDTDVNFESESEEGSAETYSESDDFGSSDADFSSGENMFTDGTSESSAPAEEAAQPVSCIVNLKNDTIEIKAEAPAGVLPNGTQMTVKAVENNTEDAELTDQYNKLAAKITEQLQSQGKNLDGFLAYNVSFTDADGNPVEPSDKVTYSFTYKEASSPELTDPAASTVTAAMIRTNKETSELELTELKAEEDKLTVETNESRQLTKAAFQSAATAAYTFVWSSAPAADDNENTENKEENGEVNNEEVNTDTNTENTEENGEETNTENNVENSEEEQNPEEAPDQEQTKMIRIITDEVNLRVAPSTEAEVIATVATDTQLPLLETVTGEDEFTWYKVSYDETEAYVRSDMAEVVETEEQDVVVEEDEEADQTVTYESTVDGVKIVVTAPDASVLPENAELVATKIDNTEEIEQIKDAIAPEVVNNQTSIKDMMAFDIKFMLDGQEIQPNGEVKVEFQNTGYDTENGISVYHVDDEKTTATDMQAVVDEEKVEFQNTGSNTDNGVSVEQAADEETTDADMQVAAEEGENQVSETTSANVSIDTTHFSTYVVVNNGSDKIKVTIEHWLYDETTNKSSQLYKDKIVELASGTDGQQLSQFTMENDEFGLRSKDPVVKIADDGTETAVSEEKIEVESAVTIRCYYVAKSGKYTNGVTMFDYDIKGNGINTLSNYKNSNSIDDKIMMGQKRETNLQYKYEVTGKDTNGNNVNIKYDINANNQSIQPIIPGIVTSLSGDNYSQVNFKEGLDEPGYFTPDTKIGKRVLDGYSLNFEKTGNKYTLTSVSKDRTPVANDLKNFWPLDSNPGEDGLNGGSDDNGRHNWYFAMRYDFKFKLGDYMGDLTYSFNGDDDLWVFMDGQPIIDLGGLHSAYPKNDFVSKPEYDSAKYDYSAWTTLYPNTVDLWNKIKGGKEKADREAEHTITVLFMERGGFGSNCNMEFVLPNVTSTEPVISTTPKADLTLKKVDSKDVPIKDVEFKLVNGNNEVKATSDKDGRVTFSNLREGTEYTLTEVSAPKEYVAETTTWKVKVESDTSGTLKAVLYKGDEPLTLNDDGTYHIVNYTQEELVSQSVESNKTVSLLDWDQRTYKIDLTASSKVTQTTTVAVPFDIVMVLDVSGSMKNDFYEYSKYTGNLGTSGDYYIKTSNGIYEQVEAEFTGPFWNQTFKNWRYWDTYQNQYVTVIQGSTDIFTKKKSITKLTALKDAATSFVNNVATKNPDNRISVVTFAGDSTIKESKDGKWLLRTGTSKDTITSWISNLNANGATNSAAGLKNAVEVFKQENNANWEDVTQNNGRQKMVVFFTDGVPTKDNTFNTSVADKAKANAKTLKDQGATIYSLGIFDSASSEGYISNGTVKQIDEYMKGVASSDEKYMTADSVSSLNGLFDSITNSMPVTVQATVTDVIDSRFKLTDASRATLEADGATITDNNGSTTITWPNVDIPGKKDSETTAVEQAGWHKEIFIQAKDEYIGGNDVPTNGAGSGINVGNNHLEFPQPTVNVKSDLVVNNKEVTIFYGDTVPTDSEIINALFNENAPQGFVTKLDENSQPKSELVTYTMGADGGAFKPEDFTIEWYTDSDCNKKINIEDLAKQKPAPESKEYYLKVTYNKLGKATSDSNDHTAKDGKTYISGDSSGTTGTGSITAYNSNDSNKKYGVYTVKVISGQIAINKKLADRDDKPLTASDDQEFTFKVTKMVNDESGNSVPDTTFGDVDPNATDKKTGSLEVTVKVEVGESEGTLVDTDLENLKNLPRGTYEVEEINVPENYQISDPNVISKKDNDHKDGTDCKYSTDAYKVIFKLGYKMDSESTDTDVIVKANDSNGKLCYTYNPENGGVKGLVAYTNKLVTADLDLKKKDAKTNDPLTGAKVRFEKWTESEGNQSEGAWKVVYDSIEVNNNNKELSGLLPGRYKLTEIKAPNNHALLGSSIYFKVESGKVLLTDEYGVVLKNEDDTPVNKGPSEMWTLAEDANGGQVLTIKNTEIYSLPSSGGPGIYGFTISGVAFITAALLLFINNKRKEDNIAG